MRNTLIFICCYVLLVTSCNSSNKKTEDSKDSTDTPTAVFPEDTQEISAVITRFAAAYLRQDQEKANALIHPDLGLYIIYRPGVADTYEKIDSINFDRPTPEYFPYTTFENDYTLTFEKLPAFDCGEEKWDKLGFFCDTTSQANQLTTIAAFDREFNGISDDALAKIKQLEKDTFRVILAKNEHLIFHVKKYDNKWYIFVLDRAYAGCDA